MNDDTLSQTDKQRRREAIFSSVSELSDLPYQRATWLDPEMENPHYSFIEFFECFYDIGAGSYDADDKNALDAPFFYDVSDGVLTSAERDVIWPVHLTLQTYVAPDGDSYDHAKILNDPAWHAVVDVASKAANALKANIESCAELRAFENPLPSPAAKRWP